MHLKLRPSAATVRDLFNYDPHTGLLTWAVAKGPAKAGDEAGSMRADGSILVTVNGRQYLANRIVWLLTYGEMPRYRLKMRDGDLGNLRLNNIISEEETWCSTSGAAYQREWRRRRRAIAEGRDPRYVERDSKDPRGEAPKPDHNPWAHNSGYSTQELLDLGRRAAEERQRAADERHANRNARRRERYARVKAETAAK